MTSRAEKVQNWPRAMKLNYGEKDAVWQVEFRNNKVLGLNLNFRRFFGQKRAQNPRPTKQNPKNGPKVTESYEAQLWWKRCALPCRIWKSLGFWPNLHFLPVFGPFRVKKWPKWPKKWPESDRELWSSVMVKKMRIAM